MGRDTTTTEADTNSEEPDLILPPEEQDQPNPLLSLAYSAAPTYFEVEWSKSACVDLPPALKAGFQADVHYLNGRAGKRLTAAARASLAVCAVCPIRDACNRHGQNEAGGIWGMETPQMRDGKDLDDFDVEWFGKVGIAIKDKSDLKGRLRAIAELVQGETA